MNAYHLSHQFHQLHPVQNVYEYVAYVLSPLYVLNPNSENMYHG
ncbi:unnamed protein product [Schistosoma margrebowiei]|uniref:Uncharacterized protein n=1 Tax=Schistosoma margrebowiei TaxID=48269 RepID=A0A3P8A545_9TREM|nr:unnamed protein product [Schistosoma margrebowiei]